MKNRPHEGARKTKTHIAPGRGGLNACNECMHACLESSPCSRHPATAAASIMPIRTITTEGHDHILLCLSCRGSPPQHISPRLRTSRSSSRQPYYASSLWLGRLFFDAVVSFNATHEKEVQSECTFAKKDTPAAIFEQLLRFGTTQKGK